MGEKNSMAKLTETQVKEIRTKLLIGYKTVFLAKEYGVNRRTIGRIKRKKTWGHICI
jgi:uncharacterized protein YjcR